jgi:hypothetical protein
MSKNNTGLRPTEEAVKMGKHYQDLINRVGPEYAALIVGHEGEGKFSGGAYYYQKTHATDVASTATDRTQMGARESFKEAQLARGWRQYGSFRDAKYAELIERGLTTFDDPGAEDLKEDMEIIELMLTERYMPDGTINPDYNEEWEKEFNTLDKGKYDRTAGDLWEVVNDPEIWAKAVNPDGTFGIRSEIASLRTYLGYRRAMQIQLFERNAAGGSDDMTAQSNSDLKASWDALVVRLIEQDTRFSALHSRWFATDMGFSRSTQVEEESVTGTLTGMDAGSLTSEPGSGDFMDVLEAGAI